MEKTLWIFPFIFGLASSFCFVFSLKRCAGQCLLFGQVEEVRRIHTGGSLIWCFFCFGASTFSVITSVFILRFLVSFQSILNNSRYILLSKVCLVWTFLAAIVTSLGFKEWCSSFRVNSCRNNNDQDWHAFTPRYSDCFGAFVWLSIITACLWLSCLCQVCFYCKYIRVALGQSRIR